MVKTAINSHAQINRKLMTSALQIFGRKNLVLRVVTRTIDAFGQLGASSTADTTFEGDLQFGMDLDERFITTGQVEIGDGVLYIHPTELSTLPTTEDLVVDGNSVWEILAQIESPELGGNVTFYTYRCKRRINVADN